MSGPGAALPAGDGPGADDLVALGRAVADLSVDPGELGAVATDRSGARPDGAPAGLVRARTADDVVATLRWSAGVGVPVVPRGAGSGLAGGALAGAGSVVLDLSGLDRIVEVEPVDGYAVVEPGVVTADLDRVARAHGLQFAPDPGSVEISTIGGNIATNAGGLRCVKHGVTRDAVLGLDVVLADGTRISTGRSSVRGVAGLDLTSLMVGSEGTLGVVVGATVRLVPAERDAVTVTGAFVDVGSAAAAAAAVMSAGVRPSMLELLDGATLGAIDDAEGTDLLAGGHALLVARTDGFAARAEADVVADVFRRAATSVRVSGDPEEAEALVRARRQALPSVERKGRVLIEDVAVPRSRLAQAVEEIGRLAARTGIEVYVFAHAGTGIIHPLVLSGDRAPDDPAVAATADGIFRLALDLGGTVSGEHGIGTLKRRWLREEIGDDALAVHARIKAALDPRGLLNPGKGF
ncbi:MAG: FAD-binding oxidoreductase [Actinomycetaceae bacterium]